MISNSILVIDDDPTIVRMLTFILGKVGFKTDIAINGEDALAKIHELEPKLIFLDVMMPKMDGYEVCQQIRNNTQLTHQPYIIILTSKGRETDQETAKEVGADEFITKPFSPSRIVARVQEVLA